MTANVSSPAAPGSSTNRSPPARLWRYALALALAGTLCGLLLGGLSAWFLGSVAIAGLSAAAFTFNFHVPGALVRLFAVGRTAAKYGERLVGHKAALADQVARRTALFRTMAEAPAVRSAGWQLGDEAKLADYLDDVEDLDFAKLRVDLPALTLGIGLTGCLVATAVVAPLALLPLGLLFLAVLVSGSGLARVGAKAWERRRLLQRNASRRLGMAMASVVPLQAERAWDAECAGALDALSEAERMLLRVNRFQAVFDMFAAMVGPAALLSVIGAAWWSGQRGEALLVPLFLAFAWLALGESLQGVSRVVIARLRRQAAQAEIDKWTGANEGARIHGAPTSVGFRNLRLAALHRRAPDGRPIGKPLTLRLDANRPTVFAGTSGCGKTSLLKQIAGWIGNDAMALDAHLLSAGERRVLTFFCPHDAAIITDTVRANLFAPAVPEGEVWRALEAVEMKDRVDQAGGLDAWITQDMLSLGEAQRLNLARAWLTDRSIVLLDEPTEHLDADQGGRILHRLLDHLRDRIVALSSHRTVDLPRTVTIRL